MNSFDEIAALVGWPAAAIFLVLRAYREGWLFFLPKGWAWDKLPSQMKSALPWAIATIASLVAVLTGAAAPVAVATSLAAAGLSSISYAGAKKLGEKIDAEKPVDYKPTLARHVGSIVVPISKELRDRVVKNGQP